MSQLWNLIKHELIDNLTSGRYILTSLVCIVLCVISIVLMSHDYQHREKQANLARGISIPPQPLSLVAKGTNEVRPVIPNFHPRYNVIGQVFMRFGEERHIFELFETPDFVYIVSIILSVLAVFLSHDSICAEKEAHTLSLVLSHSVRRSTFLLGKWIGGYISLLLSLAPAILLMFIEWSFRRAVIRYRHQYAEHVNRYIEETGDYEILHRILKADPPDLVPPKFFLSDVIAMHFNLLVALLLYSVVLFFAGQIAFMRKPLT